MKELADILVAFDALCADGKPCALATVIAVDGCADAQLGARMLVAEDGRTWGGLGGGRLERGVAQRARDVIETGRVARGRYVAGGDADDEDGGEEEPGDDVAAASVGAVEVFIQRLSPEHRGPLDAFARVVRGRRAVILCTQVGASSPGAGQCSVVAEGDDAARDGWDELRRPKLLASPSAGELFVERIVPPQALLIFGAGHDAVPLVSIAKVLGWHVTVVAPAASARLLERFATADELRVASAFDATGGVTVGPDSAVVVMTHDLRRDRAILATLRGPVRYLGLPGPRRRTRRLLASLPGGAVRGVEPGRVFSPSGLDLGGRTPEEVALSVVAEVQAVANGSTGRPQGEGRRAAPPAVPGQPTRGHKGATAKTHPERSPAVPAPTATKPNAPSPPSNGRTAWRS